jgi:hypothetical protein
MLLLFQTTREEKEQRMLEQIDGNQLCDLGHAIKIVLFDKELETMAQ